MNVSEAEVCMITRRTFVTSAAALFASTAQSQDAHDGARISALVRRIEAEYIPAGRKPTPPVSAKPTRNFGGPFPFAFLSTLDRQVVNSQASSSGSLLVLSPFGVDEFLAGRGNLGLDAFGCMASFLVRRELH